MIVSGGDVQVELAGDGGTPADEEVVNVQLEEVGVDDIGTGVSTAHVEEEVEVNGTGVSTVQVEEEAVDVNGTGVSTVQVEEDAVEVKGIGVSTVEDNEVSVGGAEEDVGVWVSVSVTGQTVV